MAWDIAVKEKIYQRLANEIFFRIYDGRYQLGEKLPSLQIITKEAGSSMETVRKAIRELQTKGLIDKTRWGYFVTSRQEKVIEYLNNYLTAIEQEYLEAKRKVEKGNCKEKTDNKLVHDA